VHARASAGPSGPYSNLMRCTRGTHILWRVQQRVTAVRCDSCTLSQLVKSSAPYSPVYIFPVIVLLS